MFFPSKCLDPKVIIFVFFGLRLQTNFKNQIFQPIYKNLVFGYKIALNLHWMCFDQIYITMHEFLMQSFRKGGLETTIERIEDNPISI